MREISDTRLPADQIKELRAILAAIQREAAHKGVAEVIDLAQKGDEIAANLLLRATI